MIGEIHSANMPWYDPIERKNKFKNRPALIIGEADSGDYTVLPLSRVTNQNRIDPYFDIKVDPNDYPQLNLTAVSYIRTHKQTVVNRACIGGRIIGDMKNDYPDLYHKAMDKLQEFNSKIRTNAI